MVQWWMEQQRTTSLRKPHGAAIKVKPSLNTLERSGPAGAFETANRRRPVLRVCALVVVVTVVLLEMLTQDTAQRKVLVTGGNGYLAQHLIAKLGSGCEVGYTVRDDAKSIDAPHATAFVVEDISSDAKGLEHVLKTFRPDVIVHASAMSSPRLCELDKERAMQSNCPELFLNSLQAYVPGAFMIYVSTDQVYNGGMGHSPYDVKDDAKPRNVYGYSKLEFEKLLKKKWPRHLILRSSNMIGEPAPYTKSSKFVQWVIGQLQLNGGKDMQLFHDEFRNFVDVNDVVSAIVAGIKKTQSYQESITLNCGGPQKLSRLELGQMVAESLGLNANTLHRASAAETDVGYDSPPDLSMVTDLSSDLGVDSTPMSITISRLVT